MRRVYKYPIQLSDMVELSMPAGARVLLVAAQHGVGTMWAEVDDLALYEVRRFRIFGTGHAIPDDSLIHVGSFLDGDFVWHLFEAIT